MTPEHKVRIGGASFGLLRALPGGRAAGEEPRPRARERRRLVLVVDDDRTLREICRDALGAEGYVVRDFASADEALGFVRSVLPDVIVMDVTLGGTDGLTALAELRANPRTREIPVIVCSGYTDLATARAAEARGATAFLTKPFSVTELLAHVAIEARAARRG